MNISFLTSRFFPESRGGAQAYTYTIAQALREKGHKVSVLYAPVWEKAQQGRSYQVAVEDSIYEGLMVRRLSFDWRSAPDRHEYLFGSNPIIKDRIVDFLTRQSAQVAHVTSCIHLSSAALTAPIALDIPVILTFTQYWTICPRSTLQRSDGSFCSGRRDGTTCLRCLYGETRPLRLIDILPAVLQKRLGQVLRDVPAIGAWNSSLSLIGAVERRNQQLPHLLRKVELIAPSRFLAQIIADSGLAPLANIRYSPHGHDLSRSARGAIKTPRGGLRFGFTGKAIPIKGVHLLVEAFKQLPVSCGAQLLIYGDTGAVPAYGRQVRDLAGDHPSIHFEGRYEHEQIGSILQGIDVVVVPSTQYENAPLTIAEAFSAKTPVIVTRLGGMAEIVAHEKNGLLFQLNDVDDLARQMRALIQDGSLWERLRAGCPPVRTVSHEVDALDGLYSELLRERQGI
jgi:glycosyltransferase involved in cell wall biosynthesis